MIGRVVHYFSNIGVAVVKLSTGLSLGDEIRIVGGENTDFNQEVESMEVDHKKIKKAKAKDEVGLKVKERVRDDYKVYKM